VRAGLEVTVVNLSRNGRLRGFATTFDFKLRFTPLNRSMVQPNHMINRSTQSTSQGLSTWVNFGQRSTSINGQHRSTVKVKKSTVNYEENTK
ncbi:hypothetical protein PIB30_109454, partial [Stylosanthes scabra]|nr:hypothetical protein [Stylosanthes scabra]